MPGKNANPVAKKALAFLASPFFLGLVATAGLAGVAREFYAGYGQPGGSMLVKLLANVHEKTIDWRMRFRGPMPGHQDVAILTIDERAIEQEGRWPWPRERTARVLDKAFEAGAKMIAFDMIFSEADPSTSIPAIQGIKRKLGERQPIAPEAQALFDEEIERANSDRKFAETIKRHSDKLVMGLYFESSVEPGRAFADACTTALFKSDPAFEYLQREKISLFVDDPKQIVLPGPVEERLQEEVRWLQQSVAARWTTEHPDEAKKIVDAFAAENAVVDEGGVAALIGYWLQNGDVEFLGVLPQNFAELKDADAPNRLLAAIEAQMPKHQRLILAGELTRAAQSYCEIAFTDADPLMSFEAFKKGREGSQDALRAAWEETNWASIWPEAQKAAPSLARTSLESWANAEAGSSAPSALEPVSRFWINIPMLRAATSHTGYFNAFLDSDGSLRRSKLVAHRGAAYAPSIALKAFLAARGYGAALELAQSDRGLFRHSPKKIAKRLSILDAKGDKVMDVPVDEGGAVAIDYAGPRASFPHVSAADLLSDSESLQILRLKKNEAGAWNSEPTVEAVNKQEFLKGKMLVFGATATGIYDLRVTPFEENYPGVETHANVLSNLLVAEAEAKGDPSLAGGSTLGFMRTDPREAKMMIAAVIALGIAMSALLSWLSSLPGLAATAAAVAGIAAIDKFFIFKSGTLIAVMFPLSTVFGVFVVLTFYKYFTEERTKRELKGTFEKYVSPAIVAEVLSDPSNIELGGKKMELTVMFSDVRGFTTISEKLDPRALSDLLNSYLTPMTDLVFAHKGTLDKYMGDAIMAFWGAPIHFPDHAKHACRCALAMLEKLKALQADYRAKGLPPIDIGIGLNTGEMSVGNMGSNTVRSYTVMGDSVNLGSRLEGINKDYGTRIIVSEFTQKAVASDFVTREVDWVKVKGKNEPVRIFELIAERKGVAEEITRHLGHFERGFELYHGKNFGAAIEEFKKALAIKPDDACAELYVERCQDFMAEPPPADWDGVVIKKTK